jgi:DNA-binding MltR family transcriptional regulator
MKKLDRGHRQELFRRGPLASTWAKIRIAYALAVFGPKTYKDLETLREVRNVFAHSTHPVRFTTRVIAVNCKKLRLGAMSLPPMFSKMWPQGFNLESREPRDRFIRTSLFLWFWLDQFDKVGGLDRPKRLRGLWDRYFP